MDSSFSFLLIPILFGLLDVVGFTLALVFHRRAPAACNFLIASTVLHLLVTFGRVGLQMSGFAAENRFVFGYAMTGFSVLNWIAYALILMAVFSGRNEPTPQPMRAKRRDRRDEDTEWDTPPASKALPKTTDNTGIEERK